jgi:hypothetical protein
MALRAALGWEPIAIAKALRASRRLPTFPNEENGPQPSKGCRSDKGGRCGEHPSGYLGLTQ